MYKIYGGDGQPYGPVTGEQLRRWFTEGRVNAQTLVQAEGTPDWNPLGTFAEFGDLRVPPPLGASGLRGGPPPAPDVARRASGKIPAGIFGILLGSLGIHKFILGYTRAGLITLLVTVLTCFIASPITHLIGLIEGIIYLCKSDEDFVRTYVEQQREWF